jgi:hypothetical protein
MSLQLAAASCIYIHRALKEKRKERTVVTKATVHKQGSAQRFNVLADLNLQSVSGLYKNFTRMSPNELEFLINLIGDRGSTVVKVCAANLKVAGSIPDGVIGIFR